MGSQSKDKSFLNLNSSEAVDRIVVKAVTDIENAEDKEGVVEVARRKFLILFKDGSQEYTEANLRLLYATQPHLFAQKIEGAYDKLGLNDDDFKSFFGPEFLSEIQAAFPILLKKAKTFGELDVALDSIRTQIDSLVTPRLAHHPFLAKFKLKCRLRIFYELRKKEIMKRSSDE